MKVKVWDKILAQYKDKGLGDKPSIFAQEIWPYLQKKNSLLDLGAGLGQDSRFFAQQGLIVTCTDNSNYALKQAKIKSIDQDIKFLNVDVAKKLPFADKSFDVVYSHLALHYLNKKDTEKLFTEIHRVLKDDGLFAALFNTIEDPEIEIKKLIPIEENYYQADNGLKKRYFCPKCLQEFTKNLFISIINDSRGKTYKDEIECLIRFLGRKI